MLRAELADTAELDGKAAKLTEEITQINTLIMGVIQQNAATAQDQEEYNKRYAELTARYEKIKRKLDAVNREIEGRESKARALDAFERELCDSFDVEFSPVRWNAMVERVDVLAGGRMVFGLCAGGRLLRECLIFC